MPNTTTQQKDTVVKNYALINGLNMYYEIYGNEGTPLVLLHGGGSTIETTFGNILPLLVKEYKIIAVELQAHGRTGDRDIDLSFEQDADDVAGLLKHLNVSKANIFGFSNGGNTAMQIAIRHPEVVNKLIVASSFYKREAFPPGFFEGMEKATLDNMPEPLKTGYLKLVPDTAHLRVMFNKDRKRMLTFKDWKDADMQSIQAPTLFILGDKDVVSTAHATAMSHLLPHAQLNILPSEHGAFIGEVSTYKGDTKMIDSTIAIIKTFLNK